MLLLGRGDSDDRLLGEAVLPLLQSLAAVSDVRPKLNARFDMPHWCAALAVLVVLAVLPICSWQVLTLCTNSGSRLRVFRCR